MVDLDATLREELFEVPVRQPVPQVPAHRNKITSGGKRNPAKPEGILTGGLGRRVRFIESPSPPRCAPSTQQSLLTILSCLLTSKHDRICPADKPTTLARRVHRVACPGCLSAKDLRTGIRHATRPTGLSRAHFAAEPEKWLRVTALLCAASIAHYEDPEGTLEELLNCFVDD